MITTVETMMSPVSASLSFDEILIVKAESDFMTLLTVYDQLEIFRYLSDKELVAVERVSRDFLKLVARSFEGRKKLDRWSLNLGTFKDRNEFMNVIDRYQNLQIIDINIFWCRFRIMEAIIWRTGCAQSVQSLRTTSEARYVFQNLTDWTPNVKRVEMIVHDGSSLLLLPRWKKLSSVSIYEFRTDSCGRRCLRSFETTLKAIGSQLTELSLTLDFEGYQTFEGQLDWIPLNDFYKTLTGEIGLNCSNLKTLKLKRVKNSAEILKFSWLSRFNELRHIEIPFSDVNQFENVLKAAPTLLSITTRLSSHPTLKNEQLAKAFITDQEVRCRQMYSKLYPKVKIKLLMSSRAMNRIQKK